jgi:hypothetical protein
MNLHIFSLCEHRAGAPSDDGLDTVRLEGAPPQSADVNDDTPRPINWGKSMIEGGEIPVIAGRGPGTLDKGLAERPGIGGIGHVP